MTEKLMAEMKSLFGNDIRRINHALSVLNFARRIQDIEGGDLATVEAAAVLHDIGIHQAEHRHGSSAGIYQEIEGPPIARTMMQKHNVPADVVEHVCKIVSQHHSAKDIDTLEFRILWDADWIVNIPEELGNIDKVLLAEKICKIFKTKTGNSIARQLYTNQ